MRGQLAAVALVASVVLAGPAQAAPAASMTRSHAIHYTDTIAMWAYGEREMRRARWVQRKCVRRTTASFDCYFSADSRGYEYHSNAVVWDRAGDRYAFRFKGYYERRAPGGGWRSQTLHGRGVRPLPAPLAPLNSARARPAQSARASLAGFFRRLTGHRFIEPLSAPPAGFSL